jgi:peptide/nickel transport system substrate-binding protein
VSEPNPAPRARIVNRRTFLATTTLSLAGGLLAACGQAPAPTVAPAPAATSAPKPAAAPTAPPAAAPTTAPAAPAATAKPAEAAKPTAAAPAGAVKRGGTLRQVMGTGLPTFEPTISTWNGSFGGLYETLIRFKLTDPAQAKFELEPGLAESWEYAKGNTELTLKLRPNVKFHDGSDWTAEVCAWNLERMMTHPKSFAKPYLDAIDKVSVADKMSVKLTLKAPSATLLVNLTNGSGRGYIISKAQFDKLGEDGFGANPSGTGPFKFDSWVKENKYTLKKWEGYWGKASDGSALPYLDAQDYRLIPEPATQLVELRAGNLDSIVIEAQDVANVTSNPDLAFEKIPGSGSFYVVLGLNQTKGPFGQSLKLRQAALHAFNREAINKTFSFGHGEVAPYPLWMPGMLGYDDKLPRYDYDVAKVKQLLTEAGFPNGVDITLTVIQRPREQQQAEVIKQMWDQVGIRTKLEVLERTAWINKLKDGANYEAAFWTATYYADPDQNSYFLQTGAPGNWGSYSNATVDKLFSEARLADTPEKRADVYKKIQMEVYNDAALASAYRLPILAARRKWVKGIEYDFNEVRMQSAWLDK